MKQLIQNLKNGETQVVEVPVPAAGAGSALVQTAVSLVSAGTERMVVEFAEKNLLGKAQSRPDLVQQMLDKARREGLLTTLEAAFNRLEQPMVLGYSSAGTITAIGSDLKGFKVGDRVACAGGGHAVHAEYAVVPQNLLVHLPDQVDFESAAFTTLGAIAMHGLRLAQVQVGECVAVIGLGLLGLLAVGIARAAGLSVLGIDLDPARVSLGEQMGAESVLRERAEEAALAFSRGRGMDAVLICADTPSDDPVQLAGVIARDRARVVAVGAVGLDIPRKLYYEKELDFIVSRSYGPGRYDPAYEERGQDYPAGYIRWTEGRNMEAVVDLLTSGKLDVRPLISHRIPIDVAAQAYEMITGKRKEPFLGVLLTYPQSAAATPAVKFLNSNAAAVTLHPGELPALGVLGAGNYATGVFLPVVKRIGGIIPVGIASASGLSAQQAARRFSFGYASSQEEQILSDPVINIVAILTRHHQHARQMLAAFQSRKKVFCEKPLAISPEQLDEIAAALAAGEPPYLMLGFNRRFAPLAQRLKAFIDDRSEPLAAHYRVNAGWLPSTHWLHDPLVGGGRIIGEGCHFIDFLTFLVGAPPITVSAQGLPDAGRYQEDNVLLTFTFKDGSIGSLSYLANGDKAFAKERVEVFTSGRAAVLDDFRLLEMAWAGKRQKVRTRLTQDKGHRGAWQAFLKAIRAGAVPPIPYDHLIGVTRASFCAVESLRSGREVSI